MKREWKNFVSKNERQKECMKEEVNVWRKVWQRRQEERGGENAQRVELKEKKIE